jgi:hypothetical protein
MIGIAFALVVAAGDPGAQASAPASAPAAAPAHRTLGGISVGWELGWTPEPPTVHLTQQHRLVLEALVAGREPLRLGVRVALANAVTQGGAGCELGCALARPVSLGLLGFGIPGADAGAFARWELPRLPWSQPWASIGMGVEVFPPAHRDGGPDGVAFGWNVARIALGTDAPLAGRLGASALVFGSLTRFHGDADAVPPWQFALGLGLRGVLTDVAAPQAGVPGFSRFTAALGVGLRSPYGSMQAGGGSLRGFAADMVHLDLELGVRLDPRLVAAVTLGLNGAEGAGRGDPLCTATGETCVSAGADVGLRFRWSFAPLASLDPWISTGMRYETVSLMPRSRPGSIDAAGWNASVGTGLDWRWSRTLGLGAYAEASAGRYSRITPVSDAERRVDPAWHGWLEGGMRVILFP